MSKGYHTRTKDLILEYMEQNRERGFRASDVYAYLLENGKKVNLTTIYRNLDKLEANKLLMKYKTAENDCATYQCVTPHGNCEKHLHMQCRKCGKVIHMECQMMKEIQEYLVQSYGFQLECPGSVLVGLCGDCKKDGEE